MNQFEQYGASGASVAGVGQEQMRSGPEKSPPRSALRTLPTQEKHRESVRDLTRVVHEKSLFGDIPFSDAKFDRAFDKTLTEAEQHLGLTVSLGNRVLGCCYCSIGDYFIGEGARIASVNTICVDQGAANGLLGGKVALRLTKGIEVWARSRRSTHILYHVTSGIKIRQADEFFRKIGMKQIGGSYGVRLF